LTMKMMMMFGSLNAVVPSARASVFKMLQKSFSQYPCHPTKLFIKCSRTSSALLRQSSVFDEIPRTFLHRAYSVWHSRIDTRSLLRMKANKYQTYTKDCKCQLYVKDGSIGYRHGYSANCPLGRASSNLLEPGAAQGNAPVCYRQLQVNGALG